MDIERILNEIDKAIQRNESVEDKLLFLFNQLHRFIIDNFDLNSDEYPNNYARMINQWLIEAMTIADENRMILIYKLIRKTRFFKEFIYGGNY